MSKTKTWGVLAGLAASSIWGGMYVVSKVVLDVIPPFTLLSFRIILAALVLGGVVWQRRAWNLTPAQFRQVFLIGVIGYGISLGLQFVGTRLSTAANGAVVTASTPTFVFLFGLWLLGERVSSKRWFALGLATLGVLAVIDPQAARLSPDLFLGNLSLAGAAVTWALYSVLVRQSTRQMDTLPVSFGAFLGGFVISIPGALWELQTESIGEITPGIVAGVLYLGIISTAVAAYAWNKAFAVLEAGVASLTFFAQPLVGTLLGVLLLGEQLTPLFIVGGAGIGAGLWLAARDPGL